jgi:hypothetical protein
MKITTLMLSLGLLAVVGCSSDPTKVQPAKAGVRGESCLASNDCKSGLVCLHNVCSANDFAITVEAKTCFQVDCEKSADCCEAQNPDCKNIPALCGDGTIANPGTDPTNIVCFSEAACALLLRL